MAAIATGKGAAATYVLVPNGNTGEPARLKSRSTLRILELSHPLPRELEQEKNTGEFGGVVPPLISRRVFGVLASLVECLLSALIRLEKRGYTPQKDQLVSNSWWTAGIFLAGYAIFAVEQRRQWIT